MISNVTFGSVNNESEDDGLDQDLDQENDGQAQVNIVVNLVAGGIFVIERIHENEVDAGPQDEHTRNVIVILVVDASSERFSNFGRVVKHKKALAFQLEDFGVSSQNSLAIFLFQLMDGKLKVFRWFLVGFDPLQPICRREII